MSTLPDLPPLPEGMSTDLQAWFDYRSPDEVREAVRSYALEAMQIGRRAGLEEAASNLTRARDALAPLLKRIEWVDDAGPAGEGWQSDELLAEISAAQSVLDDIRSLGG